jgi:tRNA U34 5-carboxymethylaminomethyl modifying GTPase MnmE/TrmE
MSLKIDYLSNSMESLFNNIVLKSNMLSLDNFKDNLYEKKLYVDDFIYSISNKNTGKISKNVLEKMQGISIGFNELYENFDDKLMIFIVGNGNVGKSTLLNALVGQEVAKTNFLPTTWKIDVYSPEVDNDTAMIKYKAGKQEVLDVKKAKDKVNDEENKSKESNKIYKENLKKELNGIVNKEQREEIKKYLGEKYIYKSKISEVRWPVKSNWILERCLLVDTPGLNQELNSLEQLGDANSYYHKADGVIWILNGQTIAAQTPNVLLEELDNSLKNVGGIRDNIIGVVNRIDLVRNNGGQEAVEKVHKDAVKHFGNKFTDIIDVSAKQAYEGIKNNDKSQIEESGILELQNAIRNIFLSKANKIKSDGKTQGNNNLVKSTVDILEQFENKIYEYENTYKTKEKNLKTSKEKLLESIKADIKSFFNNYISEVEVRVDAYINELGNGEGVDFIKRTMYRLDEFESKRNLLIKNKSLEIKNNANTWEKQCKISEYKYIDTKTSKNDIQLNINMNLNNINTNVFFKPSDEGTLLSGLGNLVGKAMFYVRKNGIKTNIIYTISNQCNEIEKKIVTQIESIIESNYKKSRNLIDITFTEILFDFKDVEYVKKQIKQFKKDINRGANDHTLEEIVGISGKEKYLKAKA